MGKGIKLAIAGLLAATLLGPAPAALANAADVIVEGPCSGGSDWKLKLSPEDGGIEVEFEVDQNVVGQRWRTTMTHNGVQFFNAVLRTVAPSGSFEARAVVSDLAGVDLIAASAVNRRTGETCSAQATF